MKIGTLTNGISGVLVLSLEVNRLGKIALIPIKKKNKIIENENIFISGMTNGENQTIKWRFEKIS